MKNVQNHQPEMEWTYKSHNFIKVNRSFPTSIMKKYQYIICIINSFISGIIGINIEKLPFFLCACVQWHLAQCDDLLIEAISRCLNVKCGHWPSTYRYSMYIS